jgi:hypothetical protein
MHPLLPRATRQSDRLSLVCLHVQEGASVYQAVSQCEIAQLNQLHLASCKGKPPTALVISAVVLAATAPALVDRKWSRHLIGTPANTKPDPFSNDDLSGNLTCA